MAEIISIKQHSLDPDKFDPITFLNDNKGATGLDHIDPEDVYHHVMDQSNVALYIHHIKTLDVPQKILVVKSVCPTNSPTDYTRPMVYIRMAGIIAENIITGHIFPFEKIIFFGALSEKWMFCADVGIKLKADGTIEYCRVRKEPLKQCDSIITTPEP